MIQPERLEYWRKYWEFKRKPVKLRPTLDCIFLSLCRFPHPDVVFDLWCYKSFDEMLIEHLFLFLTVALKALFFGSRIPGRPASMLFGIITSGLSWRFSFWFFWYCWLFSLSTTSLARWQQSWLCYRKERLRFPAKQHFVQWLEIWKRLLRKYFFYLLFSETSHQIVVLHFPCIFLLVALYNMLHTHIHSHTNKQTCESRHKLTAMRLWKKKRVCEAFWLWKANENFMKNWYVSRPFPNAMKSIKICEKKSYHRELLFFIESLPRFLNEHSFRVWNKFVIKISYSDFLLNFVSIQYTYINAAFSSKNDLSPYILWMICVILHASSIFWVIRMNVCMYRDFASLFVHFTPSWSHKLCHAKVVVIKLLQ